MQSPVLQIHISSYSPTDDLQFQTSISACIPFTPRGTIRSIGSQSTVLSRSTINTVTVGVSRDRDQQCVSCRTLEFDPQVGQTSRLDV